MTLSREELDHLHCQQPGCRETHEAIFLRSACHPTVPTWVRYEAGILTVACAECGAAIATIAVAAHWRPM